MSEHWTKSGRYGGSRNTLFNQFQRVVHVWQGRLQIFSVRCLFHIFISLWFFVVVVVVAASLLSFSIQRQLQTWCICIAKMYWRRRQSPFTLAKMSASRLQKLQRDLDERRIDGHLSKIVTWIIPFYSEFISNGNRREVQCLPVSPNSKCCNCLCVCVWVRLRRWWFKLKWHARIRVWHKNATQMALRRNSFGIRRMGVSGVAAAAARCC